MTPDSSSVPATRRVSKGQFVLACCLGAVLLAPRGVTVVVLSDAKRSLVARVDVSGDSKVSPSIKPCWSEAVVVCPRGDSSIVVTVDDGRLTATRDLDVYMEARAVGAASVVVEQGEDVDSPLKIEDVRFQQASWFWGLLPQSLFVRGILLGLAVALMVSALLGRRRR
jgi:hypothetical protein